MNLVMPAYHVTGVIVTNQDVLVQEGDNLKWRLRGMKLSTSYDGWRNETLGPGFLSEILSQRQGLHVQLTFVFE